MAVCMGCDWLPWVYGCWELSDGHIAAGIINFVVVVFFFLCSKSAGVKVEKRNPGVMISVRLRICPDCLGQSPDSGGPAGPDATSSLCAFVVSLPWSEAPMRSLVPEPFTSLLCVRCLSLELPPAPTLTLVLWAPSALLYPGQV